MRAAPPSGPIGGKASKSTDETGGRDDANVVQIQSIRSDRGKPFGARPGFKPARRESQSWAPEPSRSGTNPRGAAPIPRIARAAASGPKTPLRLMEVETRSDDSADPLCARSTRTDCFVGAAQHPDVEQTIRRCSPNGACAACCAPLETMSRSLQVMRFDLGPCQHATIRWRRSLIAPPPRPQCF